MRDRRIKNPIVAITQSYNESNALNQALELINVNQYLDCADNIVITPNFVKAKTASDAVIVGDETLNSLIQYLKQTDGNIFTASGSAEKETTDVLNEVGYMKIFSDNGIEFIDLNHGPFRELILNHDCPSNTQINTIYDRMTFLVSFTQLKQHEEATMSAAIKNIALSWPPAEQHGYPKKNTGIHTKLHEFITAMAEKITIDLSIVSTCPAMVGSGPSKGIPRNAGLVICGTDPVATDTVCARLLGYKPQAIRYLYNCANSNLGESNLDNIEILGLSIQDAEKTFSNAVYNSVVTID